MEAFCTVNTFFSAGPHAGPAGVMAFPTSDELRIEVGTWFTVRNAAAPCEAESLLAHSALLRFIHTLLTAGVAPEAESLTFISIKSGRTEGHTCVRFLVVIEPTATRQALCWAPARARLTSLMASTAASCCCVPKVAQGALAHTLPVCLGVPQAEVDTVQALVCIGTIAAFITTLRMAHTGL